MSSIYPHKQKSERDKVFGSWMKRKPHVQISQRGAEHNSSHRLYQAKGKPKQYRAIDEAIRTSQFVRNKCLRLWIDAKREDKIDKYKLNKYCAILAKEFPWAKKFNSMARQSAAEGARPGYKFYRSK